MLEKIKKQYKYVFLVLVLAAALFVWYAVFSESGNGLEVYFLDVGQGDAVFIQTPDNNQILIDGGPSKKVLSELSKVMPFYDRSIDVVIESHPDSDHTAGLVDVLNRYKVSAIFESGVSSDEPAYKELEKKIEDKNIARFLLKRGTAVNLGAGAEMEILFPDRDVSGLETNDASLVLRITYGENSFLLAGDSPVKMEKYLVSLETSGLKSDVLKISHHGSDTSTSEEFLGYVSPAYAVISVGADNRYNHPRQSVLDLLARFSIPVLRTDLSGTIRFLSDGENLEVK